MDLRLTEEQEMTRKLARELATREIAPIAAEIDETGRFPREVFEKMANAGLFGILIPPPFGGAGGARLDWLLTIEEISAASASVGWCFATSTLMGLAVLAFGSDEQKKKYLPELAKGEKLAAMFCNQVAVDVTSKAVELHGGYGSTRDFPVGRYFRDAKTLSLQKTSEHLRATAGKMLLGIPMGPPPGAGGPPG